MAKKETIWICDYCGEEIYRKAEGDFENPDGSYSSFTRFNYVAKSECPHCYQKRKKGVHNG